MTNSDQTWDWVLEAPDYPGALLAALWAQRGQRVLWYRHSDSASSPVISVDHRLYHQRGLRPPRWPFAWVQQTLTHTTGPHGFQALDSVLLDRKALIQASLTEAQQLGVTLTLIPPEQTPHLRINSTPNRSGERFRQGILKSAAGYPGVLRHHQQPDFYSVYLGNSEHLIAYPLTDDSPAALDATALVWQPEEFSRELRWDPQDIPTLYWPHYPLSPIAGWEESKGLLILRRVLQLTSGLPVAADWADLSQAYQQQLSTEAWAIF